MPAPIDSVSVLQPGADSPFARRLQRRLLVVLGLALAVAGFPSTFGRVAGEDNPSESTLPQRPPKVERPMQTERDAPTDRDALIERGRYLVDHVAKCSDCHTPRDSQGRLLTRQYLHGAVIPVNSPFPRQPWAHRSARLVGGGAFNREHLLSVLQTGRRPDGVAPRAPMPSYSLNDEDARAVVEYLYSLR